MGVGGGRQMGKDGDFRASFGPLLLLRNQTKSGEDGAPPCLPGGSGYSRFPDQWQRHLIRKPSGAG